ncbi:HEAT repeat domain-containing protein [Psychrobacter sp. NPDC078929]|uniref:HEAT repeat domain-containing protein n=1 Tax=unclassified Psychrobacter TaxID=196806 RepID=UPI003CFDDFE1
MKTITLPYWGQIIGLVSKANSTQTATQKTTKQDGHSLFITRQQQASTTVLYILDQQGEQFSLSTTALPCAMQAITKIDDSTIVMIGDDGHLYQTDWQAKKVKKTSATSLFDAPKNNNNAIGRAVAMAPLQDALAILYPKHIVVWPYQDSQASSTVIIEPYSSSIAASSKESALTALATSSDGSWLVVADKTGDVSSYQWSSDKAQLTLSSRKQLHQGRVNALCFEPVGQYFFSAGTDKCLYRTHVQGDLHPVDRAKSSQHSEMIAVLCVSDTRLFTAADDKSVKSWAFDKGQPNSCKEDLTKARQIVLSSYAEQPTLIVVSADQSLRFIPIDHTQSTLQNSTSQNSTAKNSKLLPVTYIIKDGYQRISQLLTDTSNNNDVSFKEGLALLQAQADNQTLELVKKLLADSDTLTANQALQLVQWVATTNLDKTAQVLEQQLSSAHSAKVRLAAFHALADRASTAKRPLHYLEEAFKNRYYEEVVASALQGYLKVAMKDATSQRRILPILRDALSHSFANIRKQALASLETLLPDNSPQADLMALDCNQSDIVQSGLIRLYQRGMLNHLEVSRQLMLLKNHRNIEIRQTAFYVSLLSQPKLIEALKQQGDTQTLRTLSDFDDFRLLRGTLLDNASSTATNDKSVKPSESDEAIRLTLSTQDFISQADSTQASKSKAKTTKSKKPAAESINLSNDTLEPLLQSLSNSHEDISFRAAYALACLQDKRAFGTLISLMSHNDSAIIRAGVATALGHLNIEDAKAVLPTLIDDKDAGVRQVAMQAYGKLADNALSWAATGFASKHQDIHEQSLALFLKHVAPDSSNSGDKSTQMSSEMTDILLQALNNPFTSIRLEVVKVLLNRQFKQSSDTISKNVSDDVSDSTIVDIIELLQQSLFEDVHQVAIEEWQRLLLAMNSKHKTNKANNTEETSHQKTNQAVLTLFFSDTFAAIRKQAFDIALKQSKHLGFADVMLSALASSYADTKQLALTTVQARANTTQLTQLMPAIVAMFADDSIELRKQALTVALALTDLQPTILADYSSLDDSSTDDQPNHHEALITAALNSPYPDIQLIVAQLLASQSRLYTDEEQAKRSDEQAYQVFKHYLDLPIPSQDKKSETYTQWYSHVGQALFGLSKLAYPSTYNALNWYDKYLHHPDADFKSLAPTLTLMVTVNDIDLLLKWQKDESPIICHCANFGLAILGDTRGQALLTHDIYGNIDNSNLVASKMPVYWLQAQHGLGITHARQLQPLFESESYAVAARLLLIFNDLQNGLQATKTDATSTGRPNHLIEALSFADNDTAVVYANILARYPTDVQHPNNQQALSSTWQYLNDYLSRQLGSILSSHSEVITMMMDAIPNAADKGGVKGQSNNTASIRASILTTVSTENLQQLANLSRHQQPLVRAQTISVICHLSELLAHDYYDDEDDVFETLQKWQRSLQALLSAHPVTATVNMAGNAQTVGSSPTEQQDSQEVHYPYQSLAFGAWIGVIRAGDDYYANSSTTDQAIRGLMWLATQSSAFDTNNNEDWRDSTSRVLLPLLNHSSFDTRELAWACLYKLNMPAKKLADYAMSTPYRDMVKRGLDLLLDTANNNAVQQQSKPSDTATVSSSADQQLIDLLKTNNHTLAEETYQLLKGRLGHLPASLLGLQTYCQSLLPQIVAEWKQVIVTPFANSQSPSVQRQDKLTFLLHAVKSDDWNAKYQALSQLVEFYDVLFADSTLFDSLFDFAEDSQANNEKYRSWQLLVDALTSYQFINKNTLEGRLKSGLESSFDIATAEQVANEAHLRLLVLLDDPHINKPKQFIYSDIADLRNTNLVAPLLQRLENLFEHTPQKNKEERKYLFDTLVKISGYDQHIDDYLDEREDTRWLQRQHPRDSQVLLSLFTTLMSHSDYALAALLLPSLAWVQSDDSDLSSRIDSALALAYEQMPANHTFKLVEALAYRAKRRHGSIAPLQNALRNKDADVQFAAAEGLAKCGHADGVNILMATIDYNPDAEFRSCSVLAIGELLGSSDHQNQNQNADSPNASSPVDNADKNLQVHTLYKAYDKLIKLAEDDEYYLQDVASEALGRLAQGGDFEHSPHIFELLKSHLSDPVLTTTNPAIIHWLNGLRWLNTTPAWEQIRSYIRTHIDKAIFFRPQRHAVWLLQMNNNDANKALILDILKQNNLDCAVLMVAYTAAQKTWGSLASQVYPYDWAAIQSHNTDFIEETEHLSLKRIIDNSSIDELATFITQHGAHLPADTLMALQNAIMAKQDMPTSQLTALITSSNPLTQHIGLCYLTQYPTNYLDKEMVATLQQRFDTASEQWHTLIDTINRSPTTINNSQWINMVEQVRTTISQLVWLIMRHIAITTAKGTVDKAATKQIATMLDWLNNARQPLTITSIPLLSTTVSDWWQQALLALLARPVTEDKMLSNILPTLSTVSATAQPQLAYDNQTLLENLIARIEQSGTSTQKSIITVVRNALKNNALKHTGSSTEIPINQQLLQWIKAKDADALYHCANNDNMEMTVRIRAIEALGQLHDPNIEQWLTTLMTHENSDIQKLAYKVLRRWQRAMIRAQRKRPSSSIAAQSSQDSSQKSNQGEGDSQ